MRNKMTRGYRKSGFSMIELLAIIACIALLSAIMLPVFARSRESSSTETCQGNLHQIGLGIEQYLYDWDGLYPSGAGGKYRNWVAQVQPYLRDAKLFQCPDDPNAGLPANLGGTQISYQGNGYVNANHYTQEGPLGAGTWLGAPVGTGGTGHWRGVSLPMVHDPAESILAAEAWSADASRSLVKTQFPEIADATHTSGVSSGLNPLFVGADGSCSGLFPLPDIPNQYLDTDARQASSCGDPQNYLIRGADSLLGTPNGGGVSAHHKGLANVLFCDGHVTAMNPLSTNTDGGAHNMWNAIR